MPHLRSLTLLTIIALAWPGCAAQSREETNVLLQELTFVRAAMKKQHEELRLLREQTVALTALVEKMKQAQARAQGGASVDSPAPQSSADAGSASAGVTKVGPNRYRIDRAAMRRHLSDATTLARGARIVPNYQNGRANGFKLFSIRPASLYAVVGLQNGDIVVKINGHAITTPDQALAVYTQLRTASKISVELRRRGRTVVMRYAIVE
jgi:general secretion pathway protein C